MFFEGWKGVILIVACLALLAFLAFALHADSAIIAGVAAVQVILAWITHPPGSSPPPSATTLLALVFLAWGVGACSALHVDSSAEAEATYLGEQLRCVDTAKSRAEADGCRRAVRERWGIAETATDAGGGQ